ncbi:hypothetical protein ACQZ4Q_21625 [Agrobacterium vitis]
MVSRFIAASILSLMICAAANAAEALEFGGDTYLSGFDAELASPGERDGLVGRAITFAEGARIGGALFYSAPNPIDIPPSVVSAERVHFEPLSIGAPRASRNWMHFWPATSTILFTAFIVISCLVLLAGLLFSLVPKTSESLQREVAERPFRTMGIGILGLAMLLGLLPLCIVTLIGLPFIPIVLLAVMALWVGGYLLGVMGLTMRIYGAFRPLPAGLAPKLLMIAVGLIIVALLSFVLIIGWLLNLAIMFLGLGGILSYAGRSMLSRQSTSSKSDEPGPPSINAEAAT